MNRLFIVRCKEYLYSEHVICVKDDAIEVTKDNILNSGEIVETIEISDSEIDEVITMKEI